MTAWLPLVAMPVLVMIVVPRHWPAWAFMWILSAAIFFGCKWLTWHLRRPRTAPVWRHVAYLVLWPGLDADAFLENRRLPTPLGRGEWAWAAANVGAGALLFWGVARQLGGGTLTAWVGMTGIILVLHFGTFHLLSCAWRRVGLDARPLMVRPMASQSLTEFWGRRWNTAFRDLAHRFLFQPLTRRLGPRGALGVGFLFSGVVHDVVISWPAQGGYGLPTLFFVAQGGGLLLERSRLGRRNGLGQGMRGRLFAAGMLLLAVPLLFHAPFVRSIVLPFMRDMGAL